MAITHIYKVNGTFGHRIKESFNDSSTLDISQCDRHVHTVTTLCSDILGTNDYVLVAITADSPQNAKSEMLGQASDGIFENQRIGYIDLVYRSYYTVRINENGDELEYADTLEDAIRIIDDLIDEDEQNQVEYELNYYEVIDQFGNQVYVK